MHLAALRVANFQILHVFLLPSIDFGDVRLYWSPDIRMSFNLPGDLRWSANILFYSETREGYDVALFEKI